MSKGLSIAYAIRKKAMAKGGEVKNEKLSPGSSKMPDMLKMLMKKRMMASGGEVESEENLKEDYSSQDDFLDADMPEMEMGDETYPDPDHTEDPEMQRKNRMSKIMQGLHSKHLGK